MRLWRSRAPFSQTHFSWPSRFLCHSRSNPTIASSPRNVPYTTVPPVSSSLSGGTYKKVLVSLESSHRPQASKRKCTRAKTRQRSVAWSSTSRVTGWVATHPPTTSHDKPFIAPLTKRGAFVGCFQRNTIVAVPRKRKIFAKGKGQGSWSFCFYEGLS